MSEQAHAIVERRGHVLTITLNRPEARNALSTEMMEIMSSTWDEVNANADIRVAIITGAGGAFCAGADLKAMTRMHPGDSFRQGNAGGLSAGVIKPLLKGFRLTKPLIAAVEGARFGVSEVRWGLFPLAGSTVRLRRQVPYTVAADILLTARHLKAAEAKEIGLIGYVVPDGQALAKANELADMVAANGPVAVQAVLRSLRETECIPEDEAMRIESKIGMEVFLSEDAKEGPLAFMQKRKPEFKGG